ncbi:unnamed protein product [Cylindrotheca closterium]|uniref:Altered inheritance of mitochondria protein 24, mitochondrial n=1 Tax=Cylindrotheca closterium TaxID=2856 RepID=A0AAD2PXM1_9STRA|nr:unnamed protein product [Cylindrotheca closterium]
MKIACITILLATEASAFLGIGEPMQRAPLLDEIMKSKSIEKLSINLDVGGSKEESHIVIRDTIFDFHLGAPLEHHVSLPGINGPHPSVSSGAQNLEVINGGHFVSMAGTQDVKLANSCWEINWKKDTPAGALICGFEVMEDYERNEATLTKGRTYLTFPIWNQEGLDYAREQKADVMERAEAALKEKDDEMHKISETNNPLMKALHYRNAYAAVERYSLMPVKRMEMVPGDDEVLKLRNDLFLTTKGLIWTKVLPAGRQVLLGTATISGTVSDE